MSVSPIIAVTFSDDVAVRMSTHCPNGLDLGRAARLAVAAYQSRCKRDPPAMMFAQFEAPMSGEVLRVYTATELIGAENLPRMTFEKEVTMPDDRATVVARSLRQIITDALEQGVGQDEMQRRIERYLRDDYADHARLVAADREIPDA